MSNDAGFMSRLAPKVARYCAVEPTDNIETYAVRVAGIESDAVRTLISLAVKQTAHEIDSEAATAKRAWIASARMTFAPSKRGACIVCGKFASLSQAHHVVPLAEQYDRGFETPDHEHEWLCPNHHAAIHMMIPTHPDPVSTGARMAPVINDLEPGDVGKLLDLVRRSGRRP